jgi:anthranilate synthase component I
MLTLMLTLMLIQRFHCKADRPYPSKRCRLKRPMTFPDFDQFSALAQHGNFVPVYQELVADLDTPVSAWYRVCSDRPYNFLLESVEGGESLGRYSFLGCDPLWVMEARGEQTTQTYRDGQEKTFTGDPFKVLAEGLESFNPVKLPELPPGIGGLFGFWGYELINWIEPKVTIYPIADHDLPDGLWMQIDSLLVFDQVKRKIWAIAYADLREPSVDLKAAYDSACDRVKQLVTRLEQPISDRSRSLNWNSKGNTNVKISSNFTKEDYCNAVEKSKQHIKAGDIFQVVIAQQLSTEYTGDPFNLYRSLRLVNPSPYMSYFNFKDWQIVGSSPEIMVKADNDPDGDGKIATVRPIAGTRKRGKTPQEELALERDLLADPKEVAEHVMLVDLGRNDLGRVCMSGSVCVDELMIIERYSHVMHIVSNVIGKLRPDKTAWDLLKACFPAGTVSGAPKIRAMQIINDLEPCRRGVYSGVYGYYDFEGQLNSAIAIRTMVVRPIDKKKDTHLVTVQAGAGLVADSIPESEYEETLNKARAMLDAIRCLEN